MGFRNSGKVECSSLKMGNDIESDIDPFWDNFSDISARMQSHVQSLRMGRVDHGGVRGSEVFAPHGWGDL